MQHHGRHERACLLHALRELAFYNIASPQSILAKSLTICSGWAQQNQNGIPSKGIIATTENSFDSGQRQPTCFFRPCHVRCCGRSPGRTPACPADALHMSLSLYKSGQLSTHCHELGRTHTAVGRSEVACAVPHGPSTSKSTPSLTAGTRGR